MNLGLLACFLDPVSQEVVGVYDNFIVYANPAAKSSFGKNICGMPKDKLFPADMFCEEKTPYSCTANIAGRPSLVYMTRKSQISLFYITDVSNKNPLRITPNMTNYLRNCASGLKMSADLCFESGESAPHYVSLLYRNYYCLLRAIRQIDSAVRLNISESPINTKATDLVRLCYELTDTIAKLSHADVDIKFDCNESSAVAAIDPQSIEIILLNLFSNSLKYTSSGDSICLSLTKASGNILISFYDTGAGIPEDRLSSVFRIDKFGFELSNPNAGLGLGLFISDALIRLHKGVILIESREGEGTHVRIKIPANGQPSSKSAAKEISYRSIGINSILTALSDVLESSCYGLKFED